MSGFRSGNDSVKPAPHLLAAICEFPTPKYITGVCSWFGLVNQVSWAFADSSAMKPFRVLLKPGTKFAWGAELDNAFQASKVKVVEEVQAGVRHFSRDRTTCLCPDWSQKGLGFSLVQKHCTCQEITPLCCKGGWKLVYAGSRFTTQAELRYALVEEEALAAAWALHKTCHYTLGCTTLIMAVDHKPLVQLLGDCELAVIPSMRLLRLKEKTLCWQFWVVHVPGAVHKTADSMSCYPTGHDNESGADGKCVEDSVSGACVASMSLIQGRSAMPVTWEELEAESSRDPVISALRELVISGVPVGHEQWPEEL